MTMPRINSVLAFLGVILTITLVCTGLGTTVWWAKNAPAKSYPGSSYQPVSFYSKPGSPQVKETDTVQSFTVVSRLGNPESSTQLRGYICRPKGITADAPLTEVFVLTMGRVDPRKTELRARITTVDTPTLTTTQHYWQWVEISYE
ncbi:MAG: hypothetical protein RJB39_305 [Candidatus Parcubacteria bacterium]|jgi:hypothetical protein